VLLLASASAAAAAAAAATATAALMTGKESRNHRQGRRGPRGGGSSSTTSLADVAAASSTHQASERPDVAEEQRVASKKVSALEALTRLSTHSLLSMVPTPSRAAKSSSEETRSGKEVSKSLESSPVSKRGSAGLARGPEPWGLPDSSLPPAQQHGAKAGYREWLQARGQMAMQRSLGSTARPQHATPALLPLATAVPGPTSPVNWGNMQGDMQLQWFSTAVPSQDMTPVSAGAAQQQALGFGVCSQPTLMLPGCTQTPVANGGCLQQNPMQPVGTPQSAQVYGPQTPVATPMGCSQASPMASHMAFPGCHPSTPVSGHPSTAHYSFFPQGPETPVAGQLELLAPVASQQELLPPQEDCEQEQLMAAVMPEGFSGLDKETIAQRLMEAAPCSYDD